MPLPIITPTMMAPAPTTPMRRGRSAFIRGTTGGRVARTSVGRAYARARQRGSGGTMRTALGLSVHTGWAAGVLLSDDDRVLARFHVDMGKAEHGRNVHAYHAAVEAK